MFNWVCDRRDIVYDLYSCDRYKPDIDHQYLHKAGRDAGGIWSKTGHCPCLLYTSISNIETALQAILDYSQKTLGFVICPITRT